MHDPHQQVLEHNLSVVVHDHSRTPQSLLTGTHSLTTPSYLTTWQRPNRETTDDDACIVL
jgi:hypothetical protein